MSRIDQLLELLKQEPDDQFLNYALALEYAKANEKSKAVLIIENILHQDENYLTGYYQLGQLLEQTGNSDKAKAVYSKGVEIAHKQKNNKTMGELNTALDLLED